MPAIRIFRDELMETERFGTMAVRETARIIIEQCRESDHLISMSETLLDLAERAHCKKDEDLSSAYVLLYHELENHAKDHLYPEEYHRFCEFQQMNEWKLYLLC